MDSDMPLRDENDNNVLERCVLATNLKLHTTWEQVNHYFGRFGTVERASFVHRPDRTYTQSCIVLMETKDQVDQVLGSKSHMIHGGTVTCSRFEGIEVHKKDLFSDGIKDKLVIYIEALKMNPRDAYKFIENRLHPNYHTIELFESNPSVMAITFKAKKDYQQAKKELHGYTSQAEPTAKKRKKIEF